MHAETIAASLKKSVFELKQAPLLGFYDDRNAEYEEYLQQKAEAARAAEAARLAAEKAEKDKIEAAKAAADKERIEAENARLAAERADAKKAAEALAFLNAEYGERVSNMVPKTVYVLKEATNDKLEYYEAQLETLAAQTAEKAAKLSDAEKAPTKEIVREVLQTAKSTGTIFNHFLSLSNFRQQNDETKWKTAKTLCPITFFPSCATEHEKIKKGKNSR